MPTPLSLLSLSKPNETLSKQCTRLTGAEHPKASPHVDYKVELEA